MSFSWFSVVAITLPLAVIAAPTVSLDKRIDDGLARTPPMGWNSYNHYSCAPNESIIHSNAQALIDTGLATLGYKYVTVDCGWTLPDRLANGTMTWNTARFPSGYPALGNFLHDLGLKFGVYSDGGIKMCMTGDPVQVGSLGYETVDAATFASWGADLLKYDNCYSDAATGYPNTQYSPSTSPSSHYVTMHNAIVATKRPMVYQICDWGIDFPSLWAPALGHSWRVTNDIIPAWRTIPRILNQIVSQTDFAKPGQWLDLDMLEVGNNIFTVPEEQTHFSLWAIIKSPLTIGGALKDSYKTMRAESLAILGNKDVVGYNQDSLGVAASFKRRWTAEGYEVWAGPLSGSRIVAALINNQNVARSLTLSLADVGVQSAGTLKDIWNGVTKQNVLTSYTATVAAHGTLLVELGSTTPLGQYGALSATTSGTATTYSAIYGSTTSSNYSLSITFASTATTNTVVTVSSSATSTKATYTLTASSSSLKVPLTLLASNTNTITITSSIAPKSITVTAPAKTFYPSTSFTLSSGATRTTCNTNLCSPVGSKIGNLGPAASAVATLTPPSSSAVTAGSKYVSVYFINNDIALSTSWTTGTNTRNLTLSVNGVVTRMETPLTGRSSELFSPGLGWQDTGVFGVLTDGWKASGNVVAVGNVGGGSGIVSYGSDFVGLDVLW